MREYQDTNVGLGMVPGYDTPEEKKIARLELKIKKLVSWIDLHHKEDWAKGLWEHLGK